MAIWIKQSGLKIELNDKKATIAEAIRLGWTKEGEEPKGLTIEDMSKDQLEAYAKERFKVDLDKRKGKEKLHAEVKELEEKAE